MRSGKVGCELACSAQPRERCGHSRWQVQASFACRFKDGTLLCCMFNQGTDSTWTLCGTLSLPRGCVILGHES